MDGGTVLMATYEPTAADLAAALAALGETPNTVADTLTRLGHRGRPQCDTDCPIANYLTHLFGAHGACSVLYAKLGPQELVAEIAIRGFDPVTVALPPAVAEFVRRFDRQGDYTGLNATADGQHASGGAS
jgi:hypothetical protein